MTAKTTPVPFVEFHLNGGKDIGAKQSQTYLREFEWSSFMNGGYVIRATFHDPYLTILRDIYVTDGFLQNMRKRPTPVTVKIGWRNPVTEESETHTAYLVDIKVTSGGTPNNAGIEIIAIDPPSWLLNAGKGDGIVFKGNVGSVIEQVVNRYAPNIKCEVSKTTDSSEGRWPMMRQDPKTFISSLIDWAASVTEGKSSWIVCSDGRDPKVIIKAQSEMESRDLGVINCNMLNGEVGELQSWELASDAIITQYQARLVSQGISAVSGQYIDKIVDADNAVVKDENTGSKVNTNIGPDRGFSKPQGEWGTSIMAIPELNGREMGKNYTEYLDGRARTRFMAMLPFVMRLKIRVYGKPKITLSNDLGVSKIYLKWQGTDEPAAFFLSGNWLVYGFHHRIAISPETFFFTDLYLYRIDHDAVAKKV